VKLVDTVKLRTNGTAQVVVPLIAPVVVLLAVCAAAGVATVAQPTTAASAVIARRHNCLGLFCLAGPAIPSG
jgi:hypothetical protein